MDESTLLTCLSFGASTKVNKHDRNTSINNKDEDTNGDDEEEEGIFHHHILYRISTFVLATIGQYGVGFKTGFHLKA
jgi:hypothetical protein